MDWNRGSWKPDVMQNLAVIGNMIFFFWELCEVLQI